MPLPRPFHVYVRIRTQNYVFELPPSSTLASHPGANATSQLWPRELFPTTTTEKSFFSPFPFLFARGRASCPPWRRRGQEMEMASPSPFASVGGAILTYYPNLFVSAQRSGGLQKQASLPGLAAGCAAPVEEGRGHPTVTGP